MIAYKFLASGGHAPFSDRSWPLPEDGEFGAWIEAGPGPLVPCLNGVHACEPLDLAFWLGEELWQVEIQGELTKGPQSFVARRGRLVQRIPTWDEETANEFARGCLKRAQDNVAALPVEPEHAAARERAEQYLQTAGASFESGDFVVSAYASALACTVLAPSPLEAYQNERVHQGRILSYLLGL